MDRVEGRNGTFRERACRDASGLRTIWIVRPARRHGQRETDCAGRMVPRSRKRTHHWRQEGRLRLFLVADSGRRFDSPRRVSGHRNFWPAHVHQSEGKIGDCGVERAAQAGFFYTHVERCSFFCGGGARCSNERTPGSLRASPYSKTCGGAPRTPAAGPSMHLLAPRSVQESTPGSADLRRLDHHCDSNQDATK